MAVAAKGAADKAEAAWVAAAREATPAMATAAAAKVGPQLGSGALVAGALGREVALGAAAQLPSICQFQVS